MHAFLPRPDQNQNNIKPQASFVSTLKHFLKFFEKKLKNNFFPFFKTLKKEAHLNLEN